VTAPHFDVLVRGIDGSTQAAIDDAVDRE